MAPVLALVFGLLTAPAPAVSTLAVREHIESLAAIPSRALGQPGQAEAADYVRRTLAEAGIADIRDMTFSVVVPVPHGSSLTLMSTGERMPLEPLWPNGVRTCTTPPDGLRGPLVDLGDGAITAFAGVTVNGAVALMDFHSGDAWTDAAAAGAAAIVFLDSGPAHREECEKKFTRTPLALPRFYLSGPQAARLRAAARTGSAEVRVDSLVRWEPVTASNILARIPGTEPGLAAEPVIVTAYYDALSVVPGVSPGAEQACGIATLLEMARERAREPGKRPLWILATTGHFNSLAGMAEFIASAQYRRDKPLFWPALELDARDLIIVGLDLTSRTTDLAIEVPVRFNFFAAGPEDKPRRMVQPWSRQVLPSLEAVAAEQQPAVRVFDGINRPRGLSMEALIPGRMPVDVECVDLRGQTSLSLITVQDPRPWFDSPHDTADRVRPENVAAQAAVIRVLIDQLVNGPALPLRPEPRLEDRMARIVGKTLLGGEGGAMISDVPLPGALVELSIRTEKSWTGVRTDRYALSDANGDFVSRGYEFPPSWAGEWTVKTNAYFIDARTGGITYAPELGSAGPENVRQEVLIKRHDQPARAGLFACVPIEVHGLTSAKDFRTIGGLTVLDADSNVQPVSFGYYEPWGGLGSALDFHREPFALAFLPDFEPFKLFAQTPLGDPTLLLVNYEDGSGDLGRLGRGFVARRNSRLPDTALTSARDMAAIARARVERFEDNGITSEYLSAVIARLDGTLERAEAAGDGGDPREFRALSREAWALASKDYPSVKRTADDMILAVMFYMALLAPFAVFMERLFIGTYDIQKRIAWSGGIFIAVFFIFRYIHPAFDLTFTPALVLLAFVVFVLSVAVTAIVLTRFEEQFRQMREELGEVHRADMGRLGATLGAFGLGISHLRNRMLRTTLTCLTLVLLTFTLMSFTSVRTYLGFYEREREGEAHYDGFLVTSPVGERLNPGVYTDLCDAFPDAEVLPRVWTLPVASNAMRGFVGMEAVCSASEDNGQSIRGIVRLSPGESRILEGKNLLTAGRWFVDDETDVCVIPSTLARTWGINQLETGPVTVRVRSVEYRVVGVFDDQRFNNYSDLDSYSMAPIDYETAKGKMQSLQSDLQRSESSSEVLQQQEIPRLNGAELIIVSNRLSLQAAIPPTYQDAAPDSWLASVAVVFPDAERARVALESFASRTGSILFAGLDGKRFLFSSRTGTSIQGVKNLIVPLLISALIVFNTMLGAVHERKPEIGVYNSMGLSPMHIGFLFLGEACVYAVIASVVGYLIGQSAGIAIAAFGLLEGLTLNYSALEAVWTSSMVAVVVIISSLYPAWIGGRMAVPSEDRRWRLPEAEGDTIELDLPFSVVEEDALALARYLEEFVEAHVEYQMGNFYASGLFLREFGGGYRLGATIWLAPYDLGVCQEVDLDFRPSEFEGFHEIHMTIRRLDGDEVSWRRTCRLFLSNLRKQFLLWRTLAPRQKNRYRDAVLTSAVERGGGSKAQTQTSPA